MTDGLIAGRFRIHRLLGVGGTAAVFASEDTVTAREVALKVMHPHLAARRESWEAFFEEVRAAQSIRHPQLAEVLDAGVEAADPPVVWIAMELVHGVSLAEQVRANGPLDVLDAVALGAALLEGLAAAHGGGVVHRDVTPSNIMVDPTTLGESGDPARIAAGVRLLDFGLADIPGRTTRGTDPLLADFAGADPAPGGVVASAPYASPEQLSGAPVREQSDLYQLGAALYFALTGRAPFVGDTAAIVRGHLSAPPPVPSAARRGIPRAIDQVVTTALLKQPSARYPDAAAMRRALGEASLSAAPSASSGPLSAAGEAVTAVTGVTRVLPPGTTRTTAVPSPSTGSTPRAADPAEPRRRGGAGWVAVGMTVLAVTAAAGISAMAASPVSIPTPSATVAALTAPSPTPRVSEAPPVRTTAATRVVPDVSGATLADARAALEGDGFAVGEVTTEHGPSTAETVLGTAPAAGESLPIGAVIAVRVASGQNLVPDVVGSAAAQARSVLAAAGFATSPSADPADAPVAASEPGAGALAPVGSLVTLTVRRAATPVPTPPASPTPAPSPVVTPTPVETPVVLP